MKYKVIVYYDNMPDSEHIFSNKNDAINELHRLRGVKYRSVKIFLKNHRTGGRNRQLINQKSNVWELNLGKR